MKKTGKAPVAIIMGSQSDWPTMKHAAAILDELKVALLGGTLGQASLAKLKSAAAALKLGSGDPGLDAVLAEIDLRVEVELAKMALRETR